MRWGDDDQIMIDPFPIGQNQWPPDHQKGSASQSYPEIPNVSTVHPYQSYQHGNVVFIRDMQDPSLYRLCEPLFGQILRFVILILYGCGLDIFLGMFHFFTLWFLVDYLSSLLAKSLSLLPKSHLCKALLGVKFHLLADVYR